MTVNPYSQPSVVVEHESGTGVLSPDVSPFTCPRGHAVNGMVKGVATQRL